MNMLNNRHKRSGMKWTEDEEETLKAHYPEKGPTKLAQSDLLEGRSYHSIRKKAQSMNITAQTEKNRWTPQEDEILRERYPELGAKGLHTKNMLDRTYSAISTRAKKIGLSGTYMQARMTWTEKEEKYLVQLFDSNPEKTGKELYQKGKDQGHFKNKSYSAMMDKVRSLGISKQSRWSHEDEQVLLDYFSEIGASGIIDANLLTQEKNANSIRLKAHRMGISKEGCLDFSARARQYKATQDARSENWEKMDKLKDALKGF